MKKEIQKEKNNKLSLIKRDKLDEFIKDSELTDIPQQKNFYRNEVAPLVQNGSRVYVINSDALRYEVAAELCELLVSDTKGTAKISAMQAMFPSATPYGMAALLPNEKLFRIRTNRTNIIYKNRFLNSTMTREYYILYLS